MGELNQLVVETTPSSSEFKSHFIVVSGLYTDIFGRNPDLSSEQLIALGNVFDQEREDGHSPDLFLAPKGMSIKDWAQTLKNEGLQPDFNEFVWQKWSSFNTPPSDQPSAFIMPLKESDTNLETTYNGPPLTPEEYLSWLLIRAKMGEPISGAQIVGFPGVDPEEIQTNQIANIGAMSYHGSPARTSPPFLVLEFERNGFNGETGIKTPTLKGYEQTWGGMFNTYTGPPPSPMYSSIKL